MKLPGVVFLDANNNGHADAGEAGAPNVTVVLDGRFSVQTDANGRFAFPVVATGHHIIVVVPDNLPLPWTLLNNGRAEIEVTTGTIRKSPSPRNARADHSATPVLIASQRSRLSLRSARADCFATARADRFATPALISLRRPRVRRA